MSEWKVVLTPEFRQEIRDIHSYIANTLLSPESALKQVERIMNAVESLDSLPFRYSLYEKEPWYSRGLRKLTVDNFIVFYLPNQSTNEVVIAHIFYSRRNIEGILGTELE